MVIVKLFKDFFEEQIICGYRVYKETKEIWAVNLDLLQFLHEFCAKNNLQYFMGFGTLLGAVRHQGFIPWDDDVDIIMPRKDFELLKSKASEIKKPYFLQTEETDPKYWHGGMIKLRNSNTSCIEQKEFYETFNQGIGLDILPLDYAPADGFSRQWQNFMIYLYQALLWGKKKISSYKLPVYKKSMLSIIQRLNASMIFVLINMVLSDKYLKKKLFDWQTRYEKKKTKYVALYTSFIWQKKVMPVEIFSDSVDMKFENLILPAPGKARACLEIQYGEDFLKRLRGEWRTPHHPALWAIDESYEVYQHRFQHAFKNTKEKTIVLFGTGNMVDDYYKNADKKYYPAFYVDNNPQKWGQNIRGKIIKSPKTLKEIAQDKLHLIICNNYYREIGNQLKHMGIEEYFIYTDNFSFLFGSPNDMVAFSRKMHSNSCVFLTVDSYQMELHSLLQQIRLRSKQVFIVIKAASSEELAVAKKIKSILQDLEIVDLVVLVEKIHEENFCRLYKIDMVFLYKEKNLAFFENGSINKEIRVEYI